MVRIERFYLTGKMEWSGSLFSRKDKVDVDVEQMSSYLGETQISINTKSVINKSNSFHEE